MRLAVELLLVGDGVELQKSAIREWRLEDNDRFARFGVAKLFPGEAFDGFGIVAQRVEGHFQLLGSFFLFLNLRVQAQHFFAHPLVLFDQRQIPERDSQEARRQQKEDHHAPQLAPDAQVNVHRRQLYTGRGNGSSKSFHKFLPGLERAGAVEDEPQEIIGRAGFATSLTERNRAGDVNYSAWVFTVAANVFYCRLRVWLLSVPPHDQGAVAHF